jgi:hypothetical protein
MTRSERVYRRLLVIYPRSFRAQYEDEMVRLFLEQLGDAQRSGRGRDVAALWLQSLGDVVSSAPGEHLQREEAAVAKPVDPGSVAVSVPLGPSGPTRLGYALASVPFILLIVAQVVAPSAFEPVFSNPPAIVGLPAGIVGLFVVAIWASLALVVIRATRSSAGIGVALIVFTVPAILAILAMPAVVVTVMNLKV